MVGWHHRLNGHEFEQTLGDSEGQGSLACFSPWRWKESDEQLNNNNTGQPQPLWKSKPQPSSPARSRSTDSRSLLGTGCSLARRSLCSILESEKQNACCLFESKAECQFLKGNSFYSFSFRLQSQTVSASSPPQENAFFSGGWQRGLCSAISSPWTSWGLPLAACLALAPYEQARHRLVLMEPVVQLVMEETNNKLKKKKIWESGMCWENEVLLSNGGWGQRCGDTGGPLWIGWWQRKRWRNGDLRDESALRKPGKAFWGRN